MEIKAKNEKIRFEIYPISHPANPFHVARLNMWIDGKKVLEDKDYYLDEVNGEKVIVMEIDEQEANRITEAIGKRIKSGKFGIRIYDEDEKEIREYEESIWRQELERREQKFQEELKNIKKIRIGMGGDTLRIYVTCDDFSEEAGLSEGYDKFMEKLRRAIERIINRSKSREEWMEKLQVRKTNIRTGLYNILYEDGTWGEIDIDNPHLQEALREIEEEERQRQEEARKKKEELEKRRQEALRKAKETGEEVVIRRLGMFDGDDPSNYELLREYGLDPYSECGAVVVYEVATPDGKIIEKAYPTY